MARDSIYVTWGDQLRTGKSSLKRNAVEVSGWMEDIVYNLLPFESCEKNILTPHTKYAPMAHITFLKYLEKHTRHVEKKVASLLRKGFRHLWWMVIRTYLLYGHLSHLSVEGRYCLLVNVAFILTALRWKDTQRPGELKVNWICYGTLRQVYHQCHCSHCRQLRWKPSF